MQFFRPLLGDLQGILAKLPVRTPTPPRSLSSAEELQFKDPDEAIDASLSLSSVCERFSKTMKRMRTSCFIINEDGELHETHDQRTSQIRKGPDIRMHITNGAEKDSENFLQTRSAHY